MPRGYLNDEKYRLTDIRHYIEDLMSERQVTQTELAELLGITQGAFSKKLHQMTFTAYELVIIFTELKAEPGKVGKKMVVT